MQNMKIVDSAWFGTVGFVKVYNGFETKIYCGPVVGTSERESAEHIAMRGTPVPAAQFAQWLDTTNYSTSYVDDSGL